MKKTNLTEEEFEKLVSLSRKKSEDVRVNTRDVYERLLDVLYGDKKKETDKFIAKVMKSIEAGIDSNLTEVRKKRLWGDGWQVVDPFWQMNFQAIMPLIKHVLFDKGITTYKLKNEYSTYGINERFVELSGRAVKKFLMAFTDEGERYYRELNRLGMLGKLGRNLGSFQMSGVSLSIIYDILAKMRKHLSGRNS